MSGVRGGRPRSDQAHRAVLVATRDLLATKGYEGLTIEAIAAQAGVSRQTVYRWWSSKAAVVTEAVTAGFVGARAAAPGDTGDVVADMRAWLSEYLQVTTDPTVATLLRGSIAAAAESAEDADRLHTQTTDPLRRALTDRLRGAIEAGQLRADADIDTVADSLIATILYRLLNSSAHSSGTTLVDLLLDGILVR
ncbi:TetR/AcrR family transcriptional regulator [Nocardia salmonicida]|uniref:TetR/AcrR family transcriptional regulator n=1 Tax=Nocardia salmonicida TaxID=53431 RepID=UPI003670BC58